MALPGHLLLLGMILARVVDASVLVADMTMSRMVKLDFAAPYCELYYDRGVIQSMVLGADSKKVRQMSDNLVRDLEETCKQSRSKGKNQAPGGGLMYPGTKWCGPGNIARSFDDLGQHSGEDVCCREHDRCPVTIAPGQCIHGICNNAAYTRSHCDCDAKFRRCLQTLNTEVANTIGALFFNVIQVTCFKERRPCSQWQRSLSSRMEWRRSLKYIASDDWIPRGIESPISSATTLIKTFVRTAYDWFMDHYDMYSRVPPNRYQRLFP